MPKKKKKKLFFRTSRQLRAFVFLAGSSIFLLLVFLIFSKLGNQDKVSEFKSPSIIHKIASLSAQKKPIIIDPEFSYQEDTPKSYPPQRIIIPSLNIDLPVVEAKIVDGFWETATDSASFGLGSAVPSEKGNAVIFAHALPQLFGNLGLIQKDQLIYLLTKTQWFVYRVKEIKTVLPTAIEVISPTPDKTLTLYTCSGFRDVYRFVVIAKAVKDN